MKVLPGLLIVLTLLAPAVLNGQAQGRFSDGTAISLLQWHHFVPRYDAWFDDWARAWGEANNVAITVDHVNLAEMPSSLATGIGANAGYSIYEMPIPAASGVNRSNPEASSPADIHRDLLFRVDWREEARPGKA